MYYEILNLLHFMWLRMRLLCDLLLPVLTIELHEVRVRVSFRITVWVMFSTALHTPLMYVHCTGAGG